MIQPQTQKRLIESCASQKCQIYRQLFAKAATSTSAGYLGGSSRGYSQCMATRSSRITTRPKPLNTTTVSGIRSASTKIKAVPAANLPSNSSPSPTSSTSPSSQTLPPSPAALRTAEARESALRAARLRRVAQQHEKREEEHKRAEERRVYQKRYNTAARKWVSTIIALPILLVTSYYLFDRLALGHEPKELPRFRDGEKVKETGA